MTVWGHSSWTLTTGSLACCRVSGTRARTFPWRFAQTSLRTPTKIGLTLKNLPLYSLLYHRSNSCTISLLSYFFYFHTRISNIFWHLSWFLCPPPLPHRDIWNLYTQRSHIWSCRGSRKSRLTPSSSLPSDCCLPGGTSWPGRKMKAPGRLFGNGWTRCSGKLLELLSVYSLCPARYCNHHNFLPAYRFRS